MKKLLKFLYTLDGKCELCDFDTIGKNSFKNSLTIKYVFSDGNIKTVEESAFEGCKELLAVDFKYNNKTCNCAVVVENEEETQNGDTITIQYHSFKDCTKLESVTLPECDVLTIEKEAFIGCSSLRTIYIDCNTIDIAPDAFYGLSDVTFISPQQSPAVERFARENGFSFVIGTV